jgi:hypothetical protein
MRGGALKAGQIEVTCPLHGNIEPDTLTAVLTREGRVQILHRPCYGPITVYRGPSTPVVIYAHDCGHAVILPYLEGDPSPADPGCQGPHSGGAL